ncbi:suppressor of glycerol defect [Phlyctochytrium planicorne]|nr:suppressor of glycerol defect [Phlyctochytrium planicorne]
MRQRKRTINDTTQMPASVTNLIESRAKEAEDKRLERQKKKGKGKVGHPVQSEFQAREQKELDKRFAFRFNKKILNRKKERKQERQLKKERRKEHHSSKSKLKQTPATENESSKQDGVSSSKKRRAGDDVSEEPAKKQKTGTSTKKPIDLPKATKTGDAAMDPARMKRFAESHPNFYKLLQEQNLVPGGGSRRADDEDVDYYARKLGYNKKKRETILQELDRGVKGIFSDLGSKEYDDDDVEDDSYDSLRNRPSKAKAANASDDYERTLDDMFAGLEEEDEDGDGEGEYDEEFDFDDTEGDEEDDDGLGDIDGENFDDEEEEGKSEVGMEDVDTDDEDDSEESDEDFMIEEEDDDDEDTPSSRIPSKLRKDEKGDLDNSLSEKSSAVGKYIPPGLRKQADAKTEAYNRLKRTLQGHLNRLTDANMETIVSSVEEAYRDNPRHELSDVTEIITNSILAFISDHANLLDSFVMTYASFISVVYTLVGVDFAAFLVQAAVEKYQSAITRRNDESEDSKKATNLSSFVSHLYLFNVVGARLIFDLVKECIVRASEVDIEILLKMLKIVGYQIRSDDPSALKDIVTMVQEAATKNTALQGTRAKFMVEMIMDLKNNKKKLNKKASSGASGAAGDIQNERLKKFIGNFFRRRGLVSKEALGVSLDDINSIETKGKWWLVGAAWAGRDLQDTTKQQSAADSSGNTDSGYLLKLAKQSRMNTEIRKSIFVELMASEDYIDAYERIQRLNLKDKQEREIVRVLLFCMSDQASYNPFYAWVASRFCQVSHGFKVTFQYCLWDAIREFDEGEDDSSEATIIRKVSHFAKFYSFLVIGGYLGLTILKTLDFSSIAPMAAVFTQIFFTQILFAKPTTTKDPNAIVKKVFGHLSRLVDTEILREGISFFLTQYVLLGRDGRPRMGIQVPGTSSLTDAEREVLKDRIKLVKAILAEGVE